MTNGETRVMFGWASDYPPVFYKDVDGAYDGASNAWETRAKELEQARNESGERNELERLDWEPF